MSLLAANLCGASLLAAATDTDPSVEAGREALDQWGRYPWYDPSTDGLRRVEIPDAWDWSWLPDWSGYRLGFLDTLLQWGAWGLLALMLAMAAYFLIRAYLDRSGFFDGPAARDNASQPDPSDADRIEALPFPMRTDNLDLLDEARRFGRQGDFGRAIICLYSYQLVQLDRQQRIRLTKGKTNRQYLREVGFHSPLCRLLEQTMIAFEEVFFGNHTIDRVRFESCWSRLDEFRSLAEQGAG
ncbi:MAG TPA: DUF4129 domain-containing protein [Thermoguttaceae bacterium]|nr:DUF4129 domain-containing protein [Thermoguttaceae bacterium]